MAGELAKKQSDQMVRVARLEELPEGVPVSVEAEGWFIGLVRFGDQVFAFLDECTHMEVPLTEGEASPDLVITCSAHGAKFDLRTGKVLSMPATEPLTVFPVRVEDGEVWVKLPE